jgi:enamine deaminase RidA (YjgF/YER057c/UK114 family)
LVSPPAAPPRARLALDSLKKTLAEAGLTMDDLVYVQVFCSDVSLFDTWNEVYRTYFTKEYPARAFIGSGPLLFGARFEVTGIAVKR